MKKTLLVSVFFCFLFIQPSNLFAQGIPKYSAACDSLLERDINVAFGNFDSTGILFEAVYKLGASEYPQSSISSLTLTSGELVVMSVAGKFPQVTKLVPAKEWLNVEEGCPSYVALSQDKEMMVRLIYEE